MTIWQVRRRKLTRISDDFIISLTKHVTLEYKKKTKVHPNKKNQNLFKPDARCFLSPFIAECRRLGVQPAPKRFTQQQPVGQLSGG